MSSRRGGDGPATGDGGLEEEVVVEDVKEEEVVVEDVKEEATSSFVPLEVCFWNGRRSR